MESRDRGPINHNVTMRPSRATIFVTALFAAVLAACSPVAPEPSEPTSGVTASPSATEPGPSASGASATDPLGGVTALTCLGMRPGQQLQLPYRTCPPVGGDDDADGRRGRVWEGNDEIEAEDFAPLEQCEWPTARVLVVQEDGEDGFRQYFRDPDGLVPDDGLLSEFDADAELPLDSTFSELRSGGLELWFVPDDHAVYVVGPDTTERWPRADPPIACT